jgi:hypothetical protein
VENDGPHGVSFPLCQQHRLHSFSFFHYRYFSFAPLILLWRKKNLFNLKAQRQKQQQEQLARPLEYYAVDKYKDGKFIMIIVQYFIEKIWSFVVLGGVPKSWPGSAPLVCTQTGAKVMEWKISFRICTLHYIHDDLRQKRGWIYSFRESKQFSVFLPTYRLTTNGQTGSLTSWLRVCVCVCVYSLFMGANIAK